MTISVPQDLMRPGVAQLAVPTRVRWTYVAPTLLTYWIISMLDKSNISLVIADPQFLGEMQLGGETKLLGWLAGSMFISYSLAAPVMGLGGDALRTAPRHHGEPRHLGADLFLVRPVGKLRHAARVAHRTWASAKPPAIRSRSLWLPTGLRCASAARRPSYWWIGTMIGPMLTGLIVTTLILRSAGAANSSGLGVLALALPLPMVWFLVRDKPEQHPAVNAAEINLVQSGAIEQNNDAPGRILKTVEQCLAQLSLLADDACHLRQCDLLLGLVRLAADLSADRAAFRFQHLRLSDLRHLWLCGRDHPGHRPCLGSRLSPRSVRRPRLGIGRGVPDGRGACADATWSVILMICALCAQQVGSRAPKC